MSDCCHIGLKHLLGHEAPLIPWGNRRSLAWTTLGAWPRVKSLGRHCPTWDVSKWMRMLRCLSLWTGQRDWVAINKEPLKLLCFEQPPPWHFDSHSRLAFILFGILSGILFGYLAFYLNIFWHFFWHSIRHIFWKSFWRSIANLLTFFLIFYLA